MKHFTKILLFLFFLPAFLGAQGFDWQYSARLPQESPVFFFGICGDFGVNNHYGNFDFLERATVCGSFDGGSGIAYSAGLCAEYWYRGDLALTGKIEYINSDASFKQKKTYDRRFLPPLVTEFELASKISYLTVSAGGKYRLFDSHLHIGAAIGMGIKLGESFEFTERIKSPPEASFDPDLRIQERTFETGSIGPVSNFLLYPKIILGYDLNLGRGTYATPAFTLGWQANSITSEGEWRRLSLSLGVSIHRGIF